MHETLFPSSPCTTHDRAEKKSLLYASTRAHTSGSADISDEDRRIRASTPVVINYRI